MLSKDVFMNSTNFRMCYVSIYFYVLVYIIVLCRAATRWWFWGGQSNCNFLFYL